MYTKEERAVYNKRWRAENREKKAALNKKWNAENSEKVAATVKKWREENPEFAVYAKANQAKAVENLTDSYVSSQLAQRKGIHQTARQLRQYPEIIECFRAILKVRRLCAIKNKKNGN